VPESKPVIVMDPDKVNRAMTRIAHEILERHHGTDGLAIVGVWHSHPDQTAKPSEADRRGAWLGWSYLIVAITDAGVAETRSWKLEGSRFVEEVLQNILKGPGTDGKGGQKSG